MRRISALLGLAKGKTLTEVAETVSVSRQTIYNWLKAFMLQSMGVWPTGGRGDAGPD